MTAAVFGFFVALFVRASGGGFWLSFLIGLIAITLVGNLP